jgi:hypothetical protein
MARKKMESVVREFTGTEAVRNLARLYEHDVWRKDAASVANSFAEEGTGEIQSRALNLRFFVPLAEGWVEVAG